MNRLTQVACLSAPCAAIALASCSMQLGGHGDLLAPGPPSAAAVELMPEAPRRDEEVKVIASGSTDPAGLAITYRFEWIHAGSTVRTHLDDAEDMLAGDYVKGEQWTVRVTPITEDGREGQATEQGFVVGNTPPTVTSLATSTYEPLTDELVRVATVGYDDADGDPEASKYVWRLGDRDPIMTDVGELNLSSLAVPPDHETETLIIEAIPSDGEDDNAEGIVRLGPLSLAQSTTLSRILSPDWRFGSAVEDDAIAWDERHQRFLAISDGALWEYTEDFGFVRLNPDGVFPDFGFSVWTSTAYDSTPEKERLLVFGVGTEFVMSALELHDRGNERWVDLIRFFGFFPRPSKRCLYASYFNPVAQYLVLYGGETGPCLLGSVTDQLWLLDLSVPESAQWVSGFSPLSTGVFVSGAVFVEHPSSPDELLVVGGADRSDQSQPILSMQYDFGDPTDVDISFARAGDPLCGPQFIQCEERPLGVLGVPDPERGVVVGGLGVDLAGFSFPFPPIDRVWDFVPGQDGALGTLTYRVTGLFDQLDTSLGAWMGVAAWEKGRILFWPGLTNTFEVTFRLGEIVPKDGGGYDWRSLQSPGVTVPSARSQVAVDGSHVVVTARDAADLPESKTPIFEYDLDTGRWASVSEEEAGAGPGRRDAIYGGQGANGLWVVGGDLVTPGTADMTPWHYENGTWQEVAMTGDPLPPNRLGHTVFDTGCGAEAPIGVFGGNPGGGAVDETWILRCTAGAPPCTWELLGGASPDPAIGAAIAFDGQRYAVMFGGLTGPTTASDKVYVLDACDAPELGWQEATVGAGPVGLHQSSMVRITKEGAPQLIVASGFKAPATPGAGGAHNVETWKLTEVGDGAYAWERLIDAPLSGWSDGVWDSTHGRLVLFDGLGAVGEVRLRD